MHSVPVMMRMVMLPEASQSLKGKCHGITGNIHSFKKRLIKGQLHTSTSQLVPNNTCPKGNDLMHRSSQLEALRGLAPWHWPQLRGQAERLAAAVSGCGNSSSPQYC